jgi:hypothetical protein
MIIHRFVGIVNFELSALNSSIIMSFGPHVVIVYG